MSDEPATTQAENQPAAIASAPAPRFIMLHGSITEESASSTIKQLLELNIKDPKQPIVMTLSSFGGDALEAFALYDVIKSINTPVHIVGLGKIMSAGTLILSAGEKGQRKIGKHTSLMIHQVAGGAYGNILDIESRLYEIKRIQKQAEEIYLKETKLSAKEITKIMEEKTEKFYTAEEAVKMGFADIII